MFYLLFVIVFYFYFYFLFILFLFFIYIGHGLVFVFRTMWAHLGWLGLIRLLEGSGCCLNFVGLKGVLMGHGSFRQGLAIAWTASWFWARLWPCLGLLKCFGQV